MSHHHHRHHRESTNPLIYVLILVLLVALGVLLYHEHVEDQEESERLRAIAQQQREEQLAKEEAERQAELEREELRQSDSFYQKLADGFDVNVLIVGDSIGASDEASDVNHRWANLLAASLQNNYDVSVNLTNVSMSGNCSYAGYVRTMALDDGVDYDLVVICYGQNDSIENFSLYYESIIRAVQNKYPNASILCIQESSQRNYTEKMITIQSLADHYGLPVADTIAPFQENYDELVNGSVHPNDAGYQIYYETVMSVIEPLVEARQERDPSDVVVVNDQVTVFDNFLWIGADRFTREGNTFTFQTSTSGVILGIDYKLTSGENSCKVYIDGEEYAAPKVTFNYSQRHIMIVNDWMAGDAVDVKSEIKVVFSDDEAGTTQADGFNGLAISGE